MDLGKQKLPVGIDCFEKLRHENCYYVDKTGFIIDLLNNYSEATLITRPRRFGKSLNMRMLEAFFSPESDKSIFDGLKITGEHGLCSEYMGKYPVISLSLKRINAASFSLAYKLASSVIRQAAAKVYDLVKDDINLKSFDNEILSQLLQSNIEESALYESLYSLSSILEKHYGKKVIILIDEYDVPLAKAYEHGYYDQMVFLIRNLFENTLKSNDSLKFAVLTGCMRLSKESLFTGLNNLEVMSVSDDTYSEYFGFTDREVQDLLKYYDLHGSYQSIKEWYDGYRFGSTNVYCPWDVISYCRKLQHNRRHPPENFRINTSDNSVVQKFIDHCTSPNVKSDIEALINGEPVKKKIRQELTYRDMYSSIDNIWSVLFTTGYLTYKDRLDSRVFNLAIPNLEIRDVFAEHILELFKDYVNTNCNRVNCLYEALQSENAAEAEGILSSFLRQTISLRDASVPNPLKENFYHGLLVGLFIPMGGWSVSSNQEAGNGYCDIMMRS